MEYKNYVLDDFQKEAIQHIDNNNSVVVSAATGTGKTLIADYAIDKFFKQGKHVVYTAPIKALSNQKYREFKESFGEENVGIITGDVVLNSSARILIMTTEIYRNMLLTKDPLVKNVSYVVFDEIHFLSDLERGTVWEESIIFSPNHVRFICLSATIPNSEQFASWIRSIKKDWVKPAHHVSMITELRNKSLLPVIYFVFSRALAEEKAAELAERFNFTSKTEKET